MENKLEQAADKMESKHTEVRVEGRIIFEQDAKKPNIDLEQAAMNCTYSEYAFARESFKAGAEREAMPSKKTREISGLSEKDMGDYIVYSSTKTLGEPGESPCMGNSDCSRCNVPYCTTRKIEPMLDLKDWIEIPYGARDSELGGWEYNIPEGFEASIEGGKVVMRKIEQAEEEPESLTPFEEKIRGVILDNARTSYTYTGAPGIDVYLTDENIREIAKQVGELVTQNWSRHLMDAFKKGDEAGRDYMTKIYPKWRVAKEDCFEDAPCFIVKFHNDGGGGEDFDTVICTNRLMKGEEYIDIVELDHLPKAE